MTQDDFNQINSLIGYLISKDVPSDRAMGLTAKNKDSKVRKRVAEIKTLLDKNVLNSTGHRTVSVKGVDYKTTEPVARHTCAGCVGRTSTTLCGELVLQLKHTFGVSCGEPDIIFKKVPNVEQCDEK